MELFLADCASFIDEIQRGLKVIIVPSPLKMVAIYHLPIIVQLRQKRFSFNLT